MVATDMILILVPCLSRPTSAATLRPHCVCEQCMTQNQFLFPLQYKVASLPTGGSFIIMESIEFGGFRAYQSALGRKLAEMHKTAKYDKEFGSDVNNSIGQKINISAAGNDDPVILLLYPACYYGDNEPEFGMSWCAWPACFGDSFYNSYFEVI
ncbi:protein-ribulosamine 3-kinase, chloroplastic-like isoform X2 [Carex rostrata]